MKITRLWIVMAISIPLIQADSPSQVARLKASWNSLTPAQKRSIKIAAGIGAAATVVGGSLYAYHRYQQSKQQPIALEEMNEETGGIGGYVYPRSIPRNPEEYYPLIRNEQEVATSAARATNLDVKTVIALMDRNPKYYNNERAVVDRLEDMKNAARRFKDVKDNDPDVQKASLDEIVRNVMLDMFG